jgi:hypothetical protein
MNWIQGILAGLLVVAAVMGWFVLHRRVRGDDAPLIGATKRRAREKATENELEAFIAAYRGGKVDPVALSDAPDAALEPIQTAVGGLPVSPTVMTPTEDTATAPSTAAPGSGKLLRPEVKLAYLTFRSGLRDHHVFVNVRLGDLGYGTAVGTIDLLVCDSGFKYVAAIDVCVADPPEDIAKATFLRNAGLRHLILRTRKMPKPDQLRTLIYDEPGP